jgi:CBS domain-containing protein
MRVSDLLASKGHDVATISQERNITDALAILKERGVGALVVTGPLPPLVGILSERDIVRALATQGAAALDAKVADLMTSEVRICDEDTTMASLMGLMTEHHIRHVPVVQNLTLSGLVSIGDVVKARLDELELDKKELLDYVSAR